MKRISLVCNGPSSRSKNAFTIVGSDRRFAVNHYYLNSAYQSRPTDWFVGEHVEAWNPVAAAASVYSPNSPPTVWLPGLNPAKCEKIRDVLAPWPVRLQRVFVDLPAQCRWEEDPRPMRPLTGSLALAVAVGLQPEELYVSGMDLYQHASGDDYASGVRPPDNPEYFRDVYLSGTHVNHCFRADREYIRRALDAYQGKLICVGSVMKNIFSRHYKKWMWLDG